MSADDRPGSGPLLPVTRRDAVVRRLRDDIVTGALAPGTVIKDTELAASLGMSITPVREAIAQLAAEGLIDVSPNRTRRVSQVTPEGMLDLVDVAAVLARAGVERGLENIGPERVRELLDGLETAMGYYQDGDVAAAIAAVREVADTFIGSAGNRELQVHLDLVTTRSIRTLGPLVDDVIWDLYMRGYRETLQALDRGDRAAALARHREMQAEYRARIVERVAATKAEAAAADGAAPDGAGPDPA